MNGPRPPLPTPAMRAADDVCPYSIEIGMLGIAIDVYTIPVAVPTLSAYNLGYLNSAWIGTAFFASFALGYLIWPRLCKGFAHKFSFVVAMETFNLAASHSPPSSAKTAGRLIAMRAIAGAGAGGVYGIFEASCPCCILRCRKV